MRLSRMHQNFLEKWRSADWNRHASFVTRDVLNMLRGAFAVSEPPLYTTSGARGGVLEGLGISIVDANPPKIRIRSGRGLAFDPTVVEATTDDSQLRLLENRATFDVNLAAPIAGSNAFDLIELAPAYDVTLNEARDVRAVPGGAYIPTPVDKILRPGRTVVVTRTSVAVAGIPNLAAFANGRIPIAAVFVEPAGATRVIDLRRILQPNNARHGFAAPPVVSSGTDGLSLTELYVSACEGWIRGVPFRRNVSQVATVDSIVESGVVLAANTYFFLYLAVPEPAGYSDPDGLADATTQQRDAQLWLSNIAPGQDGRPATPFVGNRPPLTAAHVGRNALYLGAVFVETIGPTNIRLFQKAQDGWVRQYTLPPDISVAGGPDVPVALTPNPVLGLSLVPITASAVRLGVILTAGGAGLGRSLVVHPGVAALPGGRGGEFVRFGDVIVGRAYSAFVQVTLGGAARSFFIDHGLTNGADVETWVPFAYLEGWTRAI